MVATNLSATSFTDTMVTAGSLYMYEVDAVNSVGPSMFTAAIPVTVANKTPLPQPTITSAIAGINQISLIWSTSAGATSYNLLREAPGESNFTSLITGVTTTSYTDSMLPVSGIYMYEVIAANATQSSLVSETVPVTITLSPVLVAPPTPTNVKAAPSATASADSVMVTWTGSMGATSYIVQREAAGETTFSTVAPSLTTTTFTDTNVTAGQSYQYTVTAVNSAGSSSATTPVTATLPPAKASLAISIGKGANSFVQFTTSQQAILKFTGAGDATVNFVADTISQSPIGKGVMVSGSNVSISDIATTGSGPTTLTITTKGGGNSVNIGGITIDGALNKINAPTAALIGTLAAGGSIKNIRLGAATAATISINGNLGVFQTASATGVSLSATGVITSIVANTWSSNHPITATSIKSIAIKADAEIPITAGTLHTLKIGGMLHDTACHWPPPRTGIWRRWSQNQ